MVVCGGIQKPHGIRNNRKKNVRNLIMIINRSQRNVTFSSTGPKGKTRVGCTRVRVRVTNVTRKEKKRDKKRKRKAPEIYPKEIESNHPRSARNHSILRCRWLSGKLRQVDKPRRPLHRSRILLIPDVFILILLILPSAKYQKLHMPLAYHPSLDLPILIQSVPAFAFRINICVSIRLVLACHVLGVVSVPTMRDSTGPFDRLPTCRSSAQRVIRFVVVIRAKRLATIDVKRFIRERFLVKNTSATQPRKRIEKNAHGIDRN